MGLMSIGDLADLLKSTGAENAALINYQGLSQTWRGIPGPYVVVAGSFRDGGQFEFAIKTDAAAERFDLGLLRDNVYFVD